MVLYSFPANKTKIFTQAKENPKSSDTDLFQHVCLKVILWPIKLSVTKERFYMLFIKIPA